MRGMAKQQKNVNVEEREEKEREKKQGEGQARMSFGEHLDELRKRVVRALYGGLIGIGLCVYFMWDIYRVVMRPYRLVALQYGLNDAFSTLKPQENFFTVLTLAIKAGLILTSPWIIFQLWQFVSAGLYKKEKRIVYRYVGPSALLFLIGVGFFYFIVLPLTLSFFVTFPQGSAASAPPKPNWLDRWLLRMEEPQKAATQPGLSTRFAALENARRWLPGEEKPGPTQLPVLGEDPPAPPEGLAILYYNAAQQQVKMRLHDRVMVLPAGATDANGAAKVEAQALPALEEDPPAPPEGVALMYYHAGERRVKVRLSNMVQVPMMQRQGDLIMSNWRSDDYLNFVAFTALIFGLAFELPMVMLVLAQVNIVAAQTYRNVRKYAYFGIVVGSVIVAPSGDIMTLAFLFVPLIVLYEVGIVASAFVTRGREEE
jgi:sec-independent protein translocase protein TatC